MIVRTHCLLDVYLHDLVKLELTLDGEVIVRVVALDETSELLRCVDCMMQLGQLDSCRNHSSSSNQRRTARYC